MLRLPALFMDLLAWTALAMEAVRRDWWPWPIYGMSKIMFKKFVAIIARGLAGVSLYRIPSNHSCYNIRVSW